MIKAFLSYFSQCVTSTGRIINMRTFFHLSSVITTVLIGIASACVDPGVNCGDANLILESSSAPTILQCMNLCKSTQVTQTLDLFLMYG